MTNLDDSLTQACRAALEAWGREMQFIVLVEELGELTVAVQHFLRGRGSAEEVLGEAADVEVMLRQLWVLMNQLQNRETYIKAKIDRIHNRISTGARVRLGEG